MITKSTNYHVKKLLYLSVVLFSGCRQSEPTQKVVSEVVSNQSHVLVSQNSTLSKHEKIKTIGIVDTCLMVIDDFEQPSVTLYSLKTGKKLKAFGYCGKADTCVNYPLYDNQYFKKDGDVKFYMSDAAKNTFLTFSLKGVLNSTVARPVEKIILPSQLAPDYLSIYKTNDDYLVGNHFTDKGKGRIFIYNLKNNNLKWEKYLPVAKQEIPSYKRIAYYYSYAAFNTDKQILATSMRKFKRVDFYDFQNDEKWYSVFKGLEDHVQLISNGNQTENKAMLYYTACFGGKKYFYAMCVDNTEINYDTNKARMKLSVFSWDGALMATIQLDKIHLGEFAVDETNKKLYAIDFDSVKKGTAQIITYNLSASKIL